MIAKTITLADSNWYKIEFSELNDENGVVIRSNADVEYSDKESPSAGESVPVNSGKTINFKRGKACFVKGVSGDEVYVAPFDFVASPGTSTTSTTTISGSGGVGGGNNTYSTMQGDFTATVTDATNDIVLSIDSIGGTSIDEGIIQSGILEVYDASGNTSISISLDGFTWTSATKTIDTSACTNAFTFATGDVVSLTLIGPDKGYDTNLDSSKDIVQNPTRSRYTDAEALISSAQEIDTTPTDLGSEIDMRGYNNLGIFLTVDIGTSTDVTIRILHKHTSGGAEEYRDIYLGTPATNITEINLNDYQVASDADQLIKLNIPVNGTSPFIQLQVSDAADGDGQIDAAYVVKSYS